MKQGKTMEELGKELQRQRAARKDFITDTRQIQFHTDYDGHSQLIIPNVNVAVNGISTNSTYEISELAHRQIATRLGIPFKYYQKMQNLAPDLLDRNVSNWFWQTPEKRMLRTLDGKLRAFLSDRYRRLDNLELCLAVLPVIKEMSDAEIVSCEVTEGNLYLKIINKAIQAEVKPGDVVQAGFVVSNSEVGLGSLRVEPLVYRLVCSNGLIVNDYGQKKYHVGRQVKAEAESYELYSDETMEQDDKTFFMKTRDIVRAAANEAQFQMIVDKLKDTTHIPLAAEPMTAVKELGDRFQLNEEEQKAILQNLFIGGDHTQYGLLNAVTATANHTENYERATLLERIGGNLLDFSTTSKRKPAKLKRVNEGNKIPWGPIENVVDL